MWDHLVRLASIAPVISVLVAICSLIVALMSAILVVTQHRGKKRAEQRLKEFENRGDAPFFKPSDWAGHISTQPGRMFSAMDPFVLSVFNDEVNLLTGEPVAFLVENIGEDFRWLTAKLNGETIELQQEPDLKRSNGVLFLVYPYQKARHGMEQTLTIAFETRNGAQRVHKYLIRHGCRFLQRIDPRLPE